MDEFTPKCERVLDSTRKFRVWFLMVMVTFCFVGDCLERCRAFYLKTPRILISLWYFSGNLIYNCSCLHIPMHLYCLLQRADKAAVRPSSSNNYNLKCVLKGVTTVFTVDASTALVHLITSRPICYSYCLYRPQKKN